MAEAPDRERSTQPEASSANDLAILSEAAQAPDVLLPRKGERRFWRRLGYPRAPRRPFLDLFPPAASQTPVQIAPGPEGAGGVKSQAAIEARSEQFEETVSAAPAPTQPEAPVEAGHHVQVEAEGPAEAGHYVQAEARHDVQIDGAVGAGSPGALAAGIEGAVSAVSESAVSAASQEAVEAGVGTAIEGEGAGVTVEERAIETAPESGAEAPSPAVYHSSAYDRAARELSDAIGRHERLMLLTGNEGSGKTTLCRTLMGQMDSRTFTALVSGPFTDIEQLLRHVLAAFGLISDVNISGPHSTRHELRVTLRDFLRSLEPLHARAILFVDDAQTLSADVLRRVSSFANIDGDKGLLQVVLVGGPALRSALASADLRTVDEQLAARVELKPLTRVEFAEYLAFHAAQTGQVEPLILDVPTLTTQYEAANGLPGLVDGDTRRPDIASPAPAPADSVVEPVVPEPEPAPAVATPVALVPEPATIAPEPEFALEPTERRTSPLTVVLFGMVVVLGGLAAWVYGTRAIDLLKAWLG